MKTFDDKTANGSCFGVVNRRRSAYGVSGLVWICAALICSVSLAQNTSDAKAKEKPADKKAPFTASLYYENAEPKQLFQMLSETYQVQFDEGAETVTEPITLIAKDVDLQGMLKQLNEALSREGKTTVLEGQIVRIVPMLDTQETWIPLNHASASDVVRFLTDLYLAKPSDKPEDQARKAKVIKAHPELPKILVIGPQNVVRDIEKLVKNELDLAPTKPAAPMSLKVPVKKKYISLDYMDAEQFSSLLKTDEMLRDQLDVTVAPNNTVIISSRDESLFKRVEEMKKAFDVDMMEIRYIPLSNALAKDVAELIESIYPKEVPRLPPELEQLQRERMGLTDQDTGLYGSITQERLEQAGMTQVSIEDLLSQPLGVVAGGELTIVPDTKNNGLLVRTFSRNLTKLLELIQELDRPRDQVLIDVFITEVLLDDTTEFGIDFTFRDNINYRNRDFTITQDVGATFDPTGLSYQLVSDNITAFISAMEKTGKLDVITRTQIGTKNNEPAMIELGRKVPLLKDTKVSSEGSISSTVTYTDVVTRLLVTPQIHPDRFVSLKIEQTIDDVSTETFQISEDFDPQVLIKRSAKSQLRIKDGQTVCLGGFISDRISRTTKGVPLLADLPFIGFLFEFATDQRVKTELLIFITPHILTTPSEMLRMTNAQRQLSNSTIRNDTDSQILEIQEQLRQPPYRDPLKSLSPP